MRILKSEIIGTPVFTERRRLIGFIKGILFDGMRGKVLAFVLNPLLKKIILPQDMMFSKDSTVLLDPKAVFEVDDIVRIAERINDLVEFCGLPVYTEAKKYLGKVQDFEFDSSSMKMTNFEVAKGFWLFSYDRRIFPKRDIVEVNKERVIVENDVEAAKEVAFKIRG